jgi:hypothetical protein
MLRDGCEARNGSVIRYDDMSHVADDETLGMARN